jgi:hypothetical protein
LTQQVVAPMQVLVVGQMRWPPGQLQLPPGPEQTRPPPHWASVQQALLAMQLPVPAQK